MSERKMRFVQISSILLIIFGGLFIFKQANKDVVKLPSIKNLGENYGEFVKHPFFEQDCNMFPTKEWVENYSDEILFHKDKFFIKEMKCLVEYSTLCWHHSSDIVYIYFQSEETTILTSGNVYMSTFEGLSISNYDELFSIVDEEKMFERGSFFGLRPGPNKMFFWENDTRLELENENDESFEFIEELKQKIQQFEYAQSNQFKNWAYDS